MSKLKEMTFEELMLDIISKWKTKDKILKELEEKYNLKINERDFRLAVENHNKEFSAHLTRYYIAHSNKGYLITDDDKYIIESEKDLQKRAFNLLIKVRDSKRARGENTNFRLEFEEIENAM